MLVGGIALLARPAARAAVPGLLAELSSAPDMHADIRARFDGGEWGWLHERVARAIDEPARSRADVAGHHPAGPDQRLGLHGRGGGSG